MSEAVEDSPELKQGLTHATNETRRQSWPSLPVEDGVGIPLDPLIHSRQSSASSKATSYREVSLFDPSTFSGTRATSPPPELYFREKEVCVPGLWQLRSTRPNSRHEDVVDSGPEGSRRGSARQDAVGTPDFDTSNSADIVPDVAVAVLLDHVLAKQNTVDYERVKTNNLRRYERHSLSTLMSAVRAALPRPESSAHLDQLYEQVILDSQSADAQEEAEREASQDLSALEWRLLNEIKQLGSLPSLAIPEEYDVRVQHSALSQTSSFDDRPSLCKEYQDAEAELQVLRERYQDNHYEYQEERAQRDRKLDQDELLEATEEDFVKYHASREQELSVQIAEAEEAVDKILQQCIENGINPNQDVPSESERDPERPPPRRADRSVNKSTLSLPLIPSRGKNGIKMGDYGRSSNTTNSDRSRISQPASADGSSNDARVRTWLVNTGPWRKELPPLKKS